MVSLRRRRVKINTSLIVVMLVLLGVTTLKRKVIQEKYVLIGWKVMAISRTMPMQPLFKIIMNHMMS